MTPEILLEKLHLGASLYVGSYSSISCVFSVNGQIFGEIKSSLSLLGNPTPGEPGGTPSSVNHVATAFVK